MNRREFLVSLPAAVSLLYGRISYANINGAKSMSNLDKLNLPRDPHEAFRMQNDVVGVRLWGPPAQPTLSIGKSDIWDRRWFEERQPLITMAKIKELPEWRRLVKK